jgi:hypothetical protein
MTPQITRLATALTLQAVALVLAHDLVYLARYGSRYGEALVHAGHGEAWTATVGTTLAIGAALLVAGVLRLAQLGILVRRAGSAGSAGGARAAAGSEPGVLELGRLGRLWLRLAPRIALLSVVLLSIQENLERSALGGPLPGPGILLSPEYPAALSITIAVGLLVGLIAALFEWHRSVLMERLRVARGTAPRPGSTPTAQPRLISWPPASSVLGRRSGLRAPPAPSAA